MNRLRTLGAITILLLSGCVDGSTGDGHNDADGTGISGNGGSANCPDLDGQWLLTAHCEPSFVGTTTEVAQTGCDFVGTNGDFVCPGTIAADGSVTQECSSPSGDVSCTGTLSGDTFSLDCNDCLVTATRQ